jgi:hypothetical protein
MKTSIWLKLIGGFCLGASSGLALLFSAICLSSWQNNEGIVTLTFNHFHERLAESILFPIWAIGGLAMSIYLIKKVFKK